MNRCAVCQKFGHASGRHKQACIVCGGDARVVERLEDVEAGYRCRDEARHEQIRAGFGVPDLVAQAVPPPVAAKKKPDKSQIRLIE